MSMNVWVAFSHFNFDKVAAIKPSFHDVQLPRPRIFNFCMSHPSLTPLSELLHIYFTRITGERGGVVVAYMFVWAC